LGATRRPTSDLPVVSVQPLLGVHEQGARLRPEVLRDVLNPTDAFKALDLKQRSKRRVISGSTRLRLDEVPETHKGVGVLCLDLRLKSDDPRDLKRVILDPSAGYESGSSPR
jgi:hypothetical protein